MTHAPSLILAALALACAAASPIADAKGKNADPAASGAQTPSVRHDWERSHRMSRILGTDVRTPGGEKIGEIRDLVVDDEGRLQLAIVSTGGFLGVGDRLHAVPWEALTQGPRDEHVLDIDKARLSQAPGFTSRSWPNLGDERWQADNRRYYPH